MSVLVSVIICTAPRTVFITQLMDSDLQNVLDACESLCNLLERLPRATRDTKIYTFQTPRKKLYTFQTPRKKLAL
jgi:hypothetical protein